MGRHKLVEYPRVVYGPYGTSLTISRVEDWPPGWASLPEGEGLPQPIARPDKVPFTRAELKAKLRAAGIRFDESAADITLYRSLPHG